VESNTDVPTVTFNGRVYTCPFRNVMPPLTAEEEAELTDRIRADGVQVAVVVTDQDELLDGHHRLRIASRLGLTDVPFDVRAGLGNDQKRELAYALNVHRRHLTRQQKRKLIANRLKTAPAQSNNAVATDLKVDDKTVATVRRELEVTSEIPKLARTRGKDGRTRAARRKPPEAAAETAPPFQRIQLQIAPGTAPDPGPINVVVSRTPAAPSPSPPPPAEPAVAEQMDLLSVFDSEADDSRPDELVGAAEPVPVPELGEQNEADVPRPSAVSESSRGLHTRARKLLRRVNSLVPRRGKVLVDQDELAAFLEDVVRAHSGK
jgi:hypothetical protein